MVQCGQLRIGGIIAAGAGFVSVPALFCAGGGFCFVVHKIMVQCGQLRIGGIIAAGAGVVSVPALFRAGGGFCCVLLQIMLCGQLFAGGIAAADAAVVSVPADFRTGGGFCCVLHQVVTAVVTPSASGAHSRTGAVRVAAAAASSLFCVAALASAGVRAVAGVVRRPRAPVVTENAVFRAA